MQPKNPITDPNYSAYEQGKNTGEGVGIAAMAVPGYVAALKAGAPKAYNALENYMVKSGGMIPLEAYHGTPHTIEGKFDISKVGTGEGAQAYGHGMYFAENPGVAKQYQKDLANHYEPYVQYGKDKIAGGALSDTDLNVFKYLETGKKQAGQFPHNTQYYAKKIAEERGDLEALKKLQEHSDIKFGEEFNPGNLYKVDIPDEYIPNMLDWDKPISQMSPELQKQIRRIAKEEYLPLEFQNAKKHGNLTGAHFYHEMVKKFDTQEGASQVLNSEGIKGIRYLDQGSRPTNIIDKRLESLYQKHGGDVEKAADDFMRTIHDSPKKKAEIRAGIIKDLENRPTSNFVVFDPSTVKILEENGKPLTRKELIEEQVNKLKD
jgi:hypothetical protein